MEESPTKKTLRFCSYRTEDKILCTITPTWRLFNENKRMKMRVCDEHLAWGIRECGYPALVDIEIPMIPSIENEIETEKD